MAADNNTPADEEGRIELEEPQDKDSPAFVRVTGNLYLKEAKMLTETTEKLLGRGIMKVVFDMSGVKYMNSAAIAALTNCAAAAKGHRGKAVLVGMTHTTENVLSTLGLLGMFLTAPTREEAIKILESDS